MSPGSHSSPICQGRPQVSIGMPSAIIISLHLRQLNYLRASPIFIPSTELFKGVPHLHPQCILVCFERQPVDLHDDDYSFPPHDILLPDESITCQDLRSSRHTLALMANCLEVHDLHCSGAIIRVRVCWKAELKKWSALIRGAWLSRTLRGTTVFHSGVQESLGSNRLDGNT